MKIIADHLTFVVLYLPNLQGAANVAEREINPSLNGSDTMMSSHGENRSYYNDVVEEIVPQTLLPVYAHQNLEFNITRSMLRRSRPIVGNTQRLHSYLNKLRSKQCTTVLFLGGSGK